MKLLKSSLITGYPALQRGHDKPRALTIHLTDPPTKIPVPVGPGEATVSRALTGLSIPASPPAPVPASAA